MGKHNIEKKSLGYSLLHKIIWFWHNIVFYRKIVLINKQNIPENANVIFTPNHQNALMDALALLFTIKRQLVFMARSDIFKKNKIANILYFLKILPIYRIRDGFDSLKKNEEIFAKTVDVLKEGNGLVILPEGNHSGKRKLRPLKKGFARIALQTEESHNFSLDLKIVPVGIDYSDYESFRSVLTLNFGEPINVSEYYEIYKQNAPVALNQLKDKLSESLKKVMINVESDVYYDLYDNLRDIYSKSYCEKLGFENNKQPNKFNADKLLIEKLEVFEKEHPQEIKSLNTTVKKYLNALKSVNISTLHFEKKQKSFFILLLQSTTFVVLSPIYVIGIVLNILPFQISLFATKIFKDRQFFSSVKLLVSFLMFPIFYLLETLIYSAFDVQQFPWIYFLLSMPLLGIITWTLHNFASKLKINWRLFLLKTRKPKVYKLIMTMFDSIIAKTDEITS
jgi:1-acyl-sn-glycerol-3-phosphate acyltransferase